MVLVYFFQPVLKLIYLDHSKSISSKFAENYKETKDWAAGKGSSSSASSISFIPTKALFLKNLGKEYLTAKKINIHTGLFSSIVLGRQKI